MAKRFEEYSMEEIKHFQHFLTKRSYHFFYRFNPDTNRMKCRPSFQDIRDEYRALGFEIPTLDTFLKHGYIIDTDLTEPYEHLCKDGTIKKGDRHIYKWNFIEYEELRPTR